MGGERGSRAVFGGRQKRICGQNPALGRGLLECGEELVVGFELGQGLLDRLHRVDRIHVRHRTAKFVDRIQMLSREQFFPVSYTHLRAPRD